MPPPKVSRPRFSKLRVPFRVVSPDTPRICMSGETAGPHLRVSPESTVKLLTTAFLSSITIEGAIFPPSMKTLVVPEFGTIPLSQLLAVLHMPSPPVHVAVAWAAARSADNATAATAAAEAMNREARFQLLVGKQGEQ